jgi:hypothetical protein
MVPDVRMFSTACSCLTYVCGLEGEGLLTSRGGDRVGCTHMGQTSYIMGSGVMRICIYLMASLLKLGFKALKTNNPIAFTLPCT